MKAFLEEYGMVIVAVIVVAALIILGTAVSTSSKRSMAGTFNSFIGLGEAQVKGAAGLDETDDLKLDADKDVGEDNYVHLGNIGEDE